MLERILVTFGTPVLICVVLPVLLVWLVAGLAVGVLASVLAFLYPIAAMAITLSIVLGKRSSGVMS